MRGQRTVSQALEYVNADFRGLARVPQQLHEEKHNSTVAEPLEIQQDVQLRGGRSHRSTCAEHPDEPLHFVHTYWRRRTTRTRTRVPRPGALTRSREAPTAMACSRINWSPKWPGWVSQRSKPRPLSAISSVTSAAPTSSTRSTCVACACLAMLCSA